ncbi:metal-dependent hydrolase family protein [Euzebya tangerina]|uniref:metal-dependent hydrolase family protein n=1 Tax=Euzebya tangerina TaxID=591198 RepID=UPI000E316794|nr:amidohydrolase family protein [Euzebya tangerina]
MTATLFADVRIFDGHDPALTSGSVLVEEGRVTRILGAGESIDHPDLTRVEGRERVLIPGLIDCHFHAYGIGLDMLVMEATPMSYTAHKAGERLGRALRRGFTTVRDVAGGDIGLARALAEGLVSGPRYLFTGPALSQTGGHGDPRPGDLAVDVTCCPHTSQVVDGADNLRRAVRELFRTGSHAIKVMTSGGVISLTDPLLLPQYSAEELAAVADEATRRGSYVAAHAYSPAAISHSVRNGVRSIEHGNLLDRPTADEMSARDAVLVPTLATYAAMEAHGADLGMTPVQIDKNAMVLTAGQDAIRIAQDVGVAVGFGTDLMGSLEVHQLEGLRLQVEAHGVLETLRSATSRAAALIGDADLGRIGRDAHADLILLDRDPFVDPSALWDPTPSTRTVFQAGRRVPPLEPGDAVPLPA